MPRLNPSAVATLVSLIAGTAVAKDIAYIGSVETVGTGGGDEVRGTVFEDLNRNSKLDAGEPGIAGVLVSNGREVVVTAADGAYALPAYDDMNVFVTKPAGY
ncbi:MAG: metallophosphoesterase N-terminal domain-containing protein, partial [Pseudomonadota bacterium]